eukprot:5968914-Pyramimonas_sp.AAC.1
MDLGLMRYAVAPSLPLSSRVPGPSSSPSSWSSIILMVWYALDNRGPGNVTVVWTKPHATPDVQKKFGIESDEYFLNWCADFFAGWAADSSAVPDDVVQRVHQQDDLTHSVLGRLLAVTLELLSHASAWLRHV